jgi:hypothetical protein
MMQADDFSESELELSKVAGDEGGFCEFTMSASVRAGICWWRAVCLSISVFQATKYLKSSYFDAMGK